MLARPTINTFLSRHARVINVTLTRVRGSSPRAEGTQMLVSPEGLWGTIGGGKLEYMAIRRAREMLNTCEVSVTMDVPLGPEIGQCCGGQVELTLTRMGKGDKRKMIAQTAKEIDALPHVYIIGAGHVGRALANQLQHMPIKTILIDMRAEELALCDADVEVRLSAIPEIDINKAPSGSAFVVLTHDHALDFLVTSAALQRGDAAYVGLIGSATKRAKFNSWCEKQCDGLSIGPLICPIGASGSNDKRPSIIATFVVAEIVAELTFETSADTSEQSGETSTSDNHLATRGNSVNLRRN